MSELYQSKHRGTSFYPYASMVSDWGTESENNLIEKLKFTKQVNYIYIVLYLSN